MPPPERNLFLHPGRRRAAQAGAAAQTAAVDFRTQFKDSLTEMPDASQLSAKGMIYVPAYSRVYGASTGTSRLIDFSTTLRIDNTSSEKPLVIERIEYYDTAGHLVQSYLKEPVALRPVRWRTRSASPRR